MRQKKVLLFLAVILTMALAAAMAAQQDQQQNTSQDQQQQQQSQPSEQQAAPKKKSGGFFTGLKAATGHGSNSQELSASAGSKGVGEGEQIANVTPTAADREAVAKMESYSVPEQTVKKFDEAGHLQFKR